MHGLSSSGNGAIYPNSFYEQRHEVDYEIRIRDPRLVKFVTIALGHAGVMVEYYLAKN